LLLLTPVAKDRIHFVAAFLGTMARCFRAVPAAPGQHGGQLDTYARNWEFAGFAFTSPQEDDGVSGGFRPLAGVRRFSESQHGLHPSSPWDQRGTVDRRPWTPGDEASL
jgi:hypothetical protein